MHDIADTRIHGTTHQRPLDRFREEAPLLIPTTTQQSFRVEATWPRTVATDYLVSLDTNRYSVPFTLIGQTVDVTRRNGQILIHHRGHLVATHPECTGRHQLLVDPTHGPGPVARNAHSGTRRRRPCTPHRTASRTSRSATSRCTAAWREVTDDTLTAGQMERLQEHLTRLRLFKSRERLEALLQDATQDELSYADFLDRVLTEEVTAKTAKHITMRTSLARFPFVKGLDAFDFPYQPSLDKKQIQTLSSCHFVEHGENVIILGPPGVGKPHLAVGLGLKAIEHGYRVLFTSAAAMVSALTKALAEGRLEEKLKVYTVPRLLVIDEIGYLQIDRTGANLFFQLISRRYEKGPMILTSNQSFGSWGDVFGNRIIATAILDRLLHHAITINVRGNSYGSKTSSRRGSSSRLRTPPNWGVGNFRCPQLGRIGCPLTGAVACDDRRCAGSLRRHAEAPVRPSGGGAVLRLRPGVPAGRTDRRVDVRRTTCTVGMGRPRRTCRRPICFRRTLPNAYRH